jgi:hypothetical protein
MSRALLACSVATAARSTTPREALVPAPAAWTEALEGLGRSDRPLGLSAQELSHFGRDHLLLTSVRDLFRDVATIPRFSGKLAEDLLDEADRPAAVVRRAWLLTDVSAGRRVPLPDAGG